jgi:hypothetical protein
VTAANPFDYLIVLVSIVLGLAITNVLTRLATVITARKRVDFYWPPVAWAIWLFLICVQHWWAEWGLHEATSWNFGTFWLEILMPVVLFLLSALVLPEREENGRLDLGQWYFHNRVWFFALLGALPLISIAEEVSRSGRMASNLNLAFLLAFAAVAGVSIFLPSRRAQNWVTTQTMIMTLAYVVLLYFRLPS